MDDVASVLAGSLPAAVYRWRPGGLEAGDRWQVRHLDGTRAATKAALLAAVGEALSFPSTYGHNLDALADLLDDLAEPTVLVWDSWAALAREDPRTFRVLLEILAERCADGARAPFVVLLAEDEGGPDLSPKGVPLLG